MKAPDMRREEGFGAPQITARRGGYFRALQLGPASRVTPIDKTSLALTIVLAAAFLGEPLTVKRVLGVFL